MTEIDRIISRIGKWFGRGTDPDRDLPLVTHVQQQDAQDAENQHNITVQTRGSLFRPWARRDAAINQLQDSFSALGQLLSSIRDNLDRQSRRHDELLGYLSHLPHALEVLPESHRVQAETLKAIHTQLAQQNYQQKQLTEILSKVSDAGQDQREHLETLRDRVESLHRSESSIAENMQNIGTAMKDVSENSHAGVEVLEQMRQSLLAREAAMDRTLKVQNTRLTVMLAIALILSAVALASVAVLGTLLLSRNS